LFLRYSFGKSNIITGIPSSARSAGGGNASPKKTNNRAPVRLASELEGADPPLRLRRHQPAREFFLEVACEIDAKLCACVQTQRVAIFAVQTQQKLAPTPRA